MSKRPESTPGSSLYLLGLADHLFLVLRKNQTSQREREEGRRKVLREADLHLGEARRESGSVGLGMLKSLGVGAD